MTDMTDFIAHLERRSQDMYTMLFDGADIKKDKLISYLNDMFYIANAIDSADGVESDHLYHRRGIEQFEYMLGKMNDALPVYIRMRRMMRNQNLNGMRTALFLLISIEKNELSGEFAAEILDKEAGDYQDDSSIQLSDDTSDEEVQDYIPSRFFSGPGLGKTYVLRATENKPKNLAPMFLENKRAKDRARHPRKPR